MSILIAGPWALAAHAQDTSRYRIGLGATPVEAALDMSRALFDDDVATSVVIGRDDAFADSLAGAVLTGGTGPLLYVPGGPGGQLPQAVAQEIDRVLPAAGDCGSTPDVYLLGGVNAVSETVEQALGAMGRCPLRLAGDSRVETSVAIAQQALQRTPTTQVLVARDDSWADAATGGAYAAYSGTPIVVTPRASLHPAVDGFLAGRGWSDIVLLGGTAALDAGVEGQVAAHGPTRRVAGDARDATAAAIATQLWPRTDAVTAVNGFRDDGWVYALAAAVPAAALVAPQVYVQADDVPPATRSYVDARGPMQLIIGAGPSSVISDAVIESLGGHGPVDDGQQGAPPADPPPADPPPAEPPPAGAGGTIPLGTYVCWQAGAYPFGDFDVVDGSTYEVNGTNGTYTYDPGPGVIDFVTGSYDWMNRGEYYPDGPDADGDGPTIVMYFDDTDGEEERITCYYAED